MTQTDQMPGAEAPAVMPPAADRDGWFAQMEERCLEEGYFEPLGQRHWAWFHDDGPVLLVTFETLDSLLARPGRLSAGHAVAAAKGWSHLCLIADGETWYRDGAVFRYFDRLVDDSFFEDFDRVVFFGAGTAAHAAAAFSVAAPGAVVVALSPRATLDPAQAGWDDRHRAARRLDFTSRYGYAPDMLEGAGAAFVLFDPLCREDAMHAALFRAAHVRALRIPHLADRAAEVLEALGILPRLLAEAGEGTLTPALFARLWRKRSRSTTYMEGLLARAEARGQQRRVWIIAREGAVRLRAPRFRRIARRLSAIHDPLTEDDLTGI